MNLQASESFYNISDSLKGLSASEASNQLSKLNLNPNLAGEILQTASDSNLLTSSIDDVNVAIENLTQASPSLFSSLTTGFKGIISTLNPLVPLLTVIGTSIAAIKAFQWADDKFTLTYGTAEKHLAESSANYSQTAQEVASLDSQLSSVQSRIAELQAQPSLSFTDQTELAALQRQEQSLQNQLTLKQNLANIQMQQAASDTKTKTEWKTEKSETEYITTGGGHGDISTPTYIPKAISQSEKLNEKLDEYDELQQKINTLGDSDPAKLKEYNTQLQEISQTISDLYSSYEADALNFYDQSTGKAVKGFEQEASEYEQIMTRVSTLGQDKAARENALMSSFFNGSSLQGSSLNDYFQELSQIKTLTEDDFTSIGLSAEMLGIDNLATAVTYFNNLADSAGQASEEISKIDGSFEGVAAAFQSENAGDKYLTLDDYLTKAKELFDQGLTGTDDFKTVAELISYGIDSSAESFQKNYKKLQSFMDTSSDKGVQNFLNELGPKYATLNSDTGKWTVDIENTAEAAQKLDLSVEAFEAILGRVQDYDLTESLEFNSVVDQFNEAKSSLEGLQDIYDNMSPGSEKNKLGADLEEWRSTLETAEGDLASLDENFVLHLKMEYDLASIQSEIDGISALIEGGDDSVSNRAALYAARENKLSIYEENAGFNVEEVEIPVHYAAAEDAIEILQEKLADTDDEELKKDIQLQISNIQQVQEDFLESFTKWNEEQPPELQISADSSIEEIQNAWEEYLNSSDGLSMDQNLINGIDEARDAVAGVLDVEPENIVIPIDADMDDFVDKLSTAEGMEITNKIVELTAEDDATPLLFLWNQLSMNPKFSSMSADDQASYVITLWNSMQPEQKQAYLSATDNASPAIQNIIASAQSADSSNPNVKISASDWASSTMNNIRNGIYSLDGLTATTYIRTVPLGGNPSSNNGGHGLNGTAHAYGTAYAYGYWGNRVSGRKLVGELGPEIIVDPYTSRWYTVGNNGPEFTRVPKNAIVFNHLQSASLLKHGYAVGRGTALAGGTALTGGTAALHGTAYASGSSDALKSLTDYYNFASLRLDRLSDATKRAIDAIDAAVTLASRQAQNTSALSKLQTVISANQSAYKKYLSHANWFASRSGLSSSYINKIKNGTLDISKLDDDTRTKVEECLHRNGWTTSKTTMICW